MQRATGRRARLAEQVQPDKIKLLTPQQVAALGPAKVAALADVCLEWGPLARPTARARSRTSSRSRSGKLLTQRRIETANAFWVYLPPVATSRRGRAARRRRAGRRASATCPSSTAAPQRYAVSLGAFRDRGRARTRGSRRSARRASANARSGPRQQVIVQTMLVDPRSAGAGRWRGCAISCPRIPEAEAKVGNCEKARDAGDDAPPRYASPRDRRRHRARARALRRVRAMAQGRSVLPGLRSRARDAARRVCAAAAGGCCSRGPQAQAFGCIALRPLAGEAGAGDGPTGDARCGRRGQATLRAAVAARRRLGTTSSPRRCSPRRARSAIASSSSTRSTGWRDAQRLYARLGFRECAPYYDNPLPGVVYMALDALTSSARAAPRAGLPCASRRACRDGGFRRAALRSRPARCRRRRSRPSPARRRHRASDGRCGR